MFIKTKGKRKKKKRRGKDFTVMGAKYKPKK